MPYDREKFIKEVYAETYQLAKDEGIPHDFIMAQVIQETGWGKHILKDTHNIFNIKAGKSWEGEKSTHKVWEIEHGKKVWVNDEFRKYESYGESVADWLDFLHDNKRYEALFEEKNLSTEEFAKRIQEAGYATDPHYAKNIVNITHGRTYKNLIAKAKASYEKEKDVREHSGMIEESSIHTKDVALMSAAGVILMGEGVIPENTLDQEVLEQRVDPKTHETLNQIEIQDRQSNQPVEEGNGYNTGSVNMDSWFTEKFGPALVQNEVASKSMEDASTTSVNEDFDNEAYVRQLIEDMNEHQGWDNTNDNDNDIQRDID